VCARVCVRVCVRVRVCVFEGDREFLSVCECVLCISYACMHVCVRACVCMCVCACVCLKEIESFYLYVNVCCVYDMHA